ncbi:Actin-like protein ARP6 [Ceratobasidium theobromae]|uniref:Actin-like protein ARP6 n=1 Tax=Ceratobasidium theobromae TaxID=1582974 RepID=A0A5N5QI41_9AGAM|nr:Actin-like protein ARP6 [Ceratobasidium theobromae]
MTGRPVVVFDNGAHTIKCGLSNSDEEPKFIPNTVIRLKGEKNKQFIGPEFDESLDYSIVHYRLPFERGYLTDWDVEKAVWDRTFFGKNGFKIDPHDHSFLVTEPNFNMHSIQETYDQMVFEEWEFSSYYRCPSAALVSSSDIFTPPDQPQPECAVVVDSGFSFTHVTPVLQHISSPGLSQLGNEILPGSIQWPSVRRLNIGGKLLTNHLKELVSFRHWDMTESTHIINQIKEACCFVSTNFSRDLEICRSNLNSNSISQSYVLPSFATEPPRPGYIRTSTSPALEESDTILPMNNERFVVPEVLFHPSDIGLAQVGLPETIAHSIESLPADMRGVAWANIGLVGGNCLFDGFEKRLYDELVALAPSEHEVCLYRAKNPLTSTFHAARTLAQSPVFPSLCVTREEYLERGTNACRRKFAPVNWFTRDIAEDELGRDSVAGRRDTGGSRREGREKRNERKGSLVGQTKNRRKKSRAEDPLQAAAPTTGPAPDAPSMDVDPKP